MAALYLIRPPPRRWRRGCLTRMQQRVTRGEAPPRNARTTAHFQTILNISAQGLPVGLLSRLHRLAQDGSELGGGGTAEIAEVDLVVPARGAQATPGEDLVVQALEHRPLFLEGPDVEGLDARAFGDGLDLHLVQAGRCTLGGDVGARGLDVGGPEPLGHHEHERPAPSGLVPGSGEGGHVLGPPQPLHRRDDVVTPPGLGGELEAVGEGIERADGLGEGWGGVGVARAVEHEIARVGDLDDVEHPCTGPVEGQRFLEIDFLVHDLPSASYSSGQAHSSSTPSAKMTVRVSSPSTIAGSRCRQSRRAMASEEAFVTVTHAAVPSTRMSVAPLTRATGVSRSMSARSSSPAPSSGPSCAGAPGELAAGAGSAGAGSALAEQPASPTRAARTRAERAGRSFIGRSNRWGPGEVRLRWPT